AHHLARTTASETDPPTCRPLPTPRAHHTDLPNAATSADGAPAQYAAKQLLGELRVTSRRRLPQHEHHCHEVFDRTRPDGDLGRTTNLRGSLSQLGYFPHHLIAPIPASLEIAGRYARVNPVVNTPGNLQTETSGVINWFFDGHSNKL